MLMSQVQQFQFSPALLASRRSSFSSNTDTSIPIRPRTSAPLPTTCRKIKGGIVSVMTTPSPLTITETPVIKTTVTMHAVAIAGFPLNTTLPRNIRKDDEGDLVLEIVSSKDGKRIRADAHSTARFPNPLTLDRYEVSFEVPVDFGEVGAVIMENGYNKLIYVENIVLQRPGNAQITITCNVNIQPQVEKPDMRVFFTNQSYLPSNTPSGLTDLRAKELENRRGNGEGERKEYDRIYDYDMYNDLGNPDKSPELARPVLGGLDLPYPRRCRTGRGPTDTDPSSEKPIDNDFVFYYVPMDEQFSRKKTLWFLASGLIPQLHTLPSLIDDAYDANAGFSSFTKINSLFNDGLPLPEKISSFMASFFPNELVGDLIKIIYQGGKYLLRFRLPELFKRDDFSWLRDEEFARQTLAGQNPLSIQLVTEWPMKSKLDADIYGSPESIITKEIVESEMKGIMTFQQALDSKKLFVLDYHDLLLPYVQKVRELDNTTLYGSRTLFFLREDGTLKPIAIELTRPRMDNEPQWRDVFTPSSDATKAWLWRIAKAHVSSHDSGYHQLVIHWLRTHCAMEPYVIAANRQLSAMHPIYRLLHPHFLDTMEINGLARKSLIPADGVIESCFSPGKYSMELSSVAYDLLWRFDMEALPADLIRRGMAVADPTAPHGLKLAIEDYPFANDGLILWDAIKSWVTDYVNHYYPNDQAIENDIELQGFWTEVQTKGHGDKKDEPWWPVLNCAHNLIQTLSTIIWVASGHHAAVNFGQYAYYGYFPNRPSIARTNVPTEDHNSTDFDFETDPATILLECFPTVPQATKVMAVVDTLSSHSTEEEYIGEKIEPSWSEDPVIKKAFEKFQDDVKKMETTIDERNADHKLRNRIGAGVVPYQLLKPTSTFGVTGMGVPNSVSI